MYNIKSLGGHCPNLSFRWCIVHFFLYFVKLLQPTTFLLSLCLKAWYLEEKSVFMHSYVYMIAAIYQMAFISWTIQHFRVCTIHMHAPILNFTIWIYYIYILNLLTHFKFKLVWWFFSKPTFFLFTKHLMKPLLSSRD